MADDSSSSSNSSIVAIFAIVLLLMLGAFIAWQLGVFGRGDTKKLEIDVNRGAVTSPLR